MLKLVCTLLLAIAWSATSAKARIGETEVECEARYGKSREVPVETGAGLPAEATESWVAKLYSSNGLTIEVVFDDSTAVFVRYSNEAVFQLRQATRPVVGLTASEITHLLKLHPKGGSSWQTYRDTTLNKIAPSVKFWRSSDKTLHAGYDRDQKRLFICTTAFWDVVVGAIKDRTKGGESGGPATRFEGL